MPLFVLLKTKCRDSNEHVDPQNSHARFGEPLRVKKTVRGTVFSDDRRLLQGLRKKYAQIALQKSRAASLLVHQNETQGLERGSRGTPKNVPFFEDPYTRTPKNILFFEDPYTRTPKNILFFEDPYALKKQLGELLFQFKTCFYHKIERTLRVLKKMETRAQLSLKTSNLTKCCQMVYNIIMEKFDLMFFAFLNVSTNLGLFGFQSKEKIKGVKVS